MKLWQMLCMVPVCLVAGGGYNVALHASERASIPDGQVITWTEKRVTEWQPKASERRIDEIGWTKDIRTAMRLAQASQRPVFIFTMDGRINLGRC